MSVPALGVNSVRGIECSPKSGARKTVGVVLKQAAARGENFRAIAARAQAFQQTFKLQGFEWQMAPRDASCAARYWTWVLLKSKPCRTNGALSITQKMVLKAAQADCASCPNRTGGL